MTSQRRLGRAPKFPHGVGDRVPARRGRARDVARHAARDGRAAASTTRSAAASPATRSTPPGPCPTSRRCSTTTRCWRAPTCTAGRSRGEARLRRVCAETLDWALREMRGPEGGFCSALDADSEGVEGKFYVWTLDELRAAARRRLAEPAIAYFGADRGGQLRGRQRARGAAAPSRPALAEIRGRLFDARAERVRPGPRRQAADRLERADDLGAGRGRRGAGARRLRGGGRRLRRVRAGRAARREGRLLRTWKDGRGQLDAYLEDHAFLLEALLTLYEATFDPRWYARGGGAGRHDHRALRRPRARRLLHHRRRPATPALPGARTWRTRRSRRAARPPRSACCGWRGCRARPRYERQALGVLRRAGADRRPPSARLRPPAAGPRLLPAPVREVAIVGDGPGADALAAVVRGAFRPHVVLAGGAARRRAAAARPPAGRRPPGRLRLRAVRLPGAGHDRRGARRGALAGRAPQGAGASQPSLATVLSKLLTMS